MLWIDTIFKTTYVRYPWIITALMVQMGILFIGIIWLLIFIEIRNRKINRFDSYTALWSDRIILWVAEYSLESQYPTIDIRMNSLSNSALREVLLRNIRVFSGGEKKFLSDLYIQFGFLNIDIKQLKSWRWWRRLLAISHINQLNLSQTLQPLIPMMNDSKPIIALAAMQTISQIGDEEIFDKLIQILIKRNIDRSDIVFQILLAIGQKKIIIPQNFIHQTQNPTLIIQAIRVLGEIKDPQSVNFILGYLRQITNVDILVAGIRALGKISDPDAENKISNFLRHENYLVRAEAVDSLAKMYGTFSDSQLKLLRNDSSVMVIRMLRKHGLLNDEKA